MPGHVPEAPSQGVPPPQPQGTAVHLTDVLLEQLVTVLQFGAQTVGQSAPVRRAIVAACDGRIRASCERDVRTARGPTALLAHRRDMALAILHTMDRAMDARLLGPATLRGVLNIIVREILLPRADQGDAAARQGFQARHGTIPPSLLTISPGKACNLRCQGCYADSGPSPEKLAWPIFARIVREARELWGVRFFAISGGEPLAYRDAGHGVLDMAGQHRDCFFLVFTNGTLIDDAVARRLGELGNVTPALSVEGLREATDGRRGPGVFDRVIAAMDRLRGHHVPFGLSMTATRDNYRELLSDPVVDLFFGRMGALYAFLFHYMPIGRAATLKLMPTAQERLWMLDRMWELVGQRHYFLADFWNSGILADGCISAGGHGGYLYIDWNGAVCPCVFVPYSPVNIHTAYAQGKDLNDVWADPFFSSIRKWQDAYNPGMGAPGPHPRGNLLRPCPIRDHHADFQRLLALHEPDPSDANACAALADPAYHAGLEAFDRELAELADPIWEERYGGARRNT